MLSILFWLFVIFVGVIAFSMFAGVAMAMFITGLAVIFPGFRKRVFKTYKDV